MTILALAQAGCDRLRECRGPHRSSVGSLISAAACISLVGCHSADTDTAKGNDAATSASTGRKAPPAPTPGRLNRKAASGGAFGNVNVAPYPGARVTQSQAVSVKLPTEHVEQASYTTKDAIDRVFRYYKSKLGSTEAIRATGGNHNRATVVKRDGNTIIVATITREAGKDETAIAIRKTTKK